MVPALPNAGADRGRDPREASAPDENELIRAAQAGDRTAFEALVRLHDKAVLRLAMNLLRSPEDARDVYQETFLRVYRNMRSFRFDCSFHTWLYRIATNLCLDQLRKRKVRREEPTVLTTAEGVLDRMDSVPEVRADGDPLRSLYSGQIRKRVKDALEQLTPRDKNGFRAAPLRRAAAETDWGNTRDHRGGGEELPVSRDAEDADRAGRVCVSEGRFS